MHSIDIHPSISVCQLAQLVCMDVTRRHEDKAAALLWLLREVIPTDSPTLVFAATRHHVEFLHTLLTREGLRSCCVYGQMDQVGAPTR